MILVYTGHQCLFCLWVSHTHPLSQTPSHIPLSCCPSGFSHLQSLPPSLIPAAPLPGSGSDTENHSFTLFTPQCTARPHRCSARAHTHTPLYGSGPQFPAHSVSHTLSAHSVSLPPHSHAHPHTHTSGELLISVLTSHLLLSCQGQGHAADAMPSRGYPPISARSPMGAAAAISHNTRECGGVSCALSVSALVTPSWGIYYSWCVRWRSPVQFTPCIVYVCVCTRVTTAQTHMHTHVVNMVPTPAQPPGPAQEMGDFPSSRPSHPLPGFSLTPCLSITRKRAPTKCLAPIVPASSVLCPRGGAVG